MSSMRALQLPASATGFGLPGCWTLARDRAITLDARQSGYLRIAQGAVWATLEGPHLQGAANEWGDQVLRSGARIHLASGQQVVLESYPLAANEEACFSWEPELTEPVPLVTVRARVSPRLGAWFAALDRRLLRWLQPGPGWPRPPADLYAQQRDRAWRNLYHLGINQP
ncbi:DUF2917 domain-containing protein [Comamonadaceae bacterium G21597-S1]|nr:DUF2917 domain-containing protein [Comamonadaceae bacterium G21597-S1]